jgi:hypothetical protein
MMDATSSFLDICDEFLMTLSCVGLITVWHVPVRIT